MAIEAYMEIRDSNGNVIDGPEQKGGRSGLIRVDDLQWTWAATTKDVATGRSSGRVQMQLMSVSSPVGPQSPRLFEATTHGVNSVTISFWGPNTRGEHVNIYSIVLTDPEVGQFQTNFQTTPDGTQLFDNYGFTVRKIEFVWGSGPLKVSASAIP